jgi:hypothetical protein
MSGQVEVTPKERELIKKYKLDNEVLTTKGDGSDGVRVSDLINGVEYKLKSVGILLNNEEVIKEACKSFKTFLEVSASFGGEEVVEL